MKFRTHTCSTIGGTPRFQVRRSSDVITDALLCETHCRLDQLFVVALLNRLSEEDITEAADETMKQWDLEQPTTNQQEKA